MMHPELHATVTAYIGAEIEDSSHRYDLLHTVTRAWESLGLPETFDRTALYAAATLIAGIVGTWNVYYGEGVVLERTLPPIDREQAFLRLIEGGE